MRRSAVRHLACAAIRQRVGAFPARKLSSAAAQDKLAATDEPVFIIDLLRGACKEYVEAAHQNAQCCHTLTPHHNSVLIGSKTDHQMTHIIVSQYGSGKAAHESLKTEPTHPSAMKSNGSLMLVAYQTPAFATLKYLQEGEAPKGASLGPGYSARSARDVPFCQEADANIECWEDLSPPRVRVHYAAHPVRHALASHRFSRSTLQ